MRSRSGISNIQPQNRIDAFRLIDNELNRVKNLIDQQLTASSESVSGLLEIFGSGSGKMLRPGLVLLAGKCFGKLTDEHIRIAAIIEMIHDATLLHDDVIDEGQKRRGLPTVNSRRGNESAVLLGDYLLGQVFRMCVNLEPQITEVIAATTMRLCEGELRQITQRQNWQLSESEYIDIISEKTAALFSSSCFLGASLAGADGKSVQALADYGHNLGVTFQITDDLLDLVGEEVETGKTLGSDVGKNKLTLPMIHLLAAVGEGKKSRVISKLGSIAANKSQRADIAEMLKSYGSLRYARSRTQEFIGKAIASLADVKESSAKEALIETAKFVAGRVA